MGIAKFDEATPDNPKVIAAGPIAAWLWFCGVCYSRRALTDGYIPKAVVPGLVVGLRAPFVHATKLCDVGLWHEDLGGYRIHDFEHWNPTKAQVDQYREKDRIRKQAKHAGGFPTRGPDGFRPDADVGSARIPIGRRRPLRADSVTRAGATSESDLLDLSDLPDLSDFNRIDQNPEIPRGRASLARMDLEVYELRRHLHAKTHTLIESGAPYVDAAGPVVGELVAELGRFVVQELKSATPHPRDLTAIVEAVMRRRAARARQADIRRERDRRELEARRRTS